MKLIDANIVLRYLLNDVEKQRPVNPAFFDALFWFYNLCVKNAGKMTVKGEIYS